jgi:hypothetical protein
MQAVMALTAKSGLTASACAALGVARASVDRARTRRLRPPPASSARRAPPRALGPQERSRVLDLPRTPRFVDVASAELYATLLDEGVYHCSIRTLYRILAENGELRERRDQLRHPVYHKPERLAEAPNQVCSWDSTKLRGPAKWSISTCMSSSTSSAAAVSAGAWPTLKARSWSRSCPVQSTGLFKALACSKHWPVQSTGLFKELSCSRSCPVQGAVRRDLRQAGRLTRSTDAARRSRRSHAGQANRLPAGRSRGQQVA